MTSSAFRAVAPVSRFVRLSRHSRARTHRALQNRTLRRRAGALQEWQAQKESACGRFSAEERAASGEAGERTGAFLRQSGHFCPQCGQLSKVKMALFFGYAMWIDAVFRRKPELCRSCRHFFGAFLYLGGKGQ